MANIRKKDCIYVDTTGTITVDAMKPILYAILVTPSSTDCRFVLKESVGGVTVVDVKIETEESRYISFDAFYGIELTSSFQIATLTNVSSVILYGYWLSPVGRAR